MESDAYYITDKGGVDMALGGLNATLRDYSKFGYFISIMVIGLVNKLFRKIGSKISYS